ncbi:hypothetical protein CRE_07598 [Caenorhabditis remanei]|uniref:Uncharacterized protein n=1 Tax=Caenorhabditis remanei TaxID=31234 RepID=E3MP70_CAERE|nr:hypothetical protein CRE_07598 [Caenorhabditis remanei]
MFNEYLEEVGEVLAPLARRRMETHQEAVAVWRERFQKWQHPGLAIGEDLDLTCYFFRPADQEGPVPQMVKRAANPKSLYQNQHPVAENNNPWSAFGKEAKEKWREIWDQVRAEQDHLASKGLARYKSGKKIETEEMLENEIESEDQQNKLTHYKELYDGFFYLAEQRRILILSIFCNEVFRARSNDNLLRKLVQECKMEESKKDEADDTFWHVPRWCVQDDWTQTITNTTARSYQTRGARGGYRRRGDHRRQNSPSTRPGHDGNGGGRRSGGAPGGTSALRKKPRSRPILRGQLWRMAEPRSREKSDLNEYLFILEKGEAPPQVAKKPCNSTNFYQNQRPARRGNPNWTTKSTSSKKKWEEAWKEARRQQDLQVRSSLIVFRADMEAGRVKTERIIN